MITQITKDIYEHVMQEQELSICFQPIVSLDKERLIGCEALMRASYHDEPISAEALFHYARKHECEHDLDFLCREISVKEYVKMNKDVMLFINFEMSLLKDYIDHLDYYLNILQQLEISKEKIVIEINEKRVRDNKALIKFVTCFREQGFLIALDDVGEGYSNLNRIILTKPDIIKIDRSAIKDMQNNYYKCEIVRFITELASRIGTVVIAEGVEEQEEIFACLSLGITLFQGYYFSKAVNRTEFNQLDYYKYAHDLSSQYKIKAENKVIQKSVRGFERKYILQKLIKLLTVSRRVEYETIIYEFFYDYNELECIYIIDNTGKQITKTLFNTNVEFKSAYLFTPAKIEDYHIVKPYYYVVMYKKEETYVSDRYISAATGHFCETYSCVFHSSEKEELILCLDFSVKE